MISLSGLHIAQAIKIPNICGLHHSVLSQHHPGNSCWTARSPFQGRCVPGQTPCCRCRLQPLVRVYLVVWQHEQDDALPCDEILELLNTTALSPLFSFPPIFFTKHLQWFCTYWGDFSTSEPDSDPAELRGKRPFWGRMLAVVIPCSACSNGECRVCSVKLPNLILWHAHCYLYQPNDLRIK